MTPLLRFALLLCPREFRREYGEQIDADAAHGVAFAHVWDLVKSGVSLRWESFATALAQAVRSLGKSRLVTLVSVATLALAIGANAAVFGVIRSVVLAPLPYSKASQLVFLCPESRCDQQIDAPTIRAYATQTKTLSGVGSFQWTGATLTGHGAPYGLQVAWSSWNVFDVLGAVPQLGRFFTPADASYSVARVVLSNSLWRKEFDADPTIVGRTIALDGNPWQVIGVAPSGLLMPAPYAGVGTDNVDLWMPMPESAFLRGRNELENWTFARVKPGVSSGELQADIDRVSASLQREYPIEDKSVRVGAAPFERWYFREVDVLLAIASGAVLLVLAIACANVSNLLLARSFARSSELALRGAIGAGFGRIAGQIFLEAALLATAGGALGVALAWMGLRAIVRFAPSALPRLESAHLDGGVLLFTVGAVVAATLAAGTIPALATARRDLATALKSGGRGTASGRGKLAHAGFAVAEIALAFAVIVGSLLLVRTFVAIGHEPQGYKVTGVYASELVFSGDRYYASPKVRVDAMRRILQNLGSIPSVSGTAYSRNPPLSSSGADGGTVRIPGQTYPPGGDRYAPYSSVTPSYFRTLGIPVLRGRAFDDGDRAGTQRVAIASELFARRFFGDASPIGKRIEIVDLSGKPALVSVVGLVGDIRPFPGEEAEGYLYLPYAQYPSTYGLPLVKLRSPDVSIAQEMARAVAAVDPQQSLGRTWSFAAASAAHIERRRASALLLSTLAALALVLALAGIYAVSTLNVEARAAEFGLRMALGARMADVVTLVMRGTLLLAIAGIACGAVIAAFATRGFAPLLYGVSPLDPLSLVAAVGLILVCAAAAALLPARRAARVDPAVALRCD